MAELFEPTTINGMTTTNRFVRSATFEGLATPDGEVTPRLTKMMVELARGEVGLIISGFAFVSPEGQTMSGQLAVHDERFVPGLQQMAEAVHTAGTKIALQVAHSGCFANPELTGLETIGASPAEENGQPSCRGASRQDLTKVVSDFATAAERAKRAGYDAVQLHAAHGFLLNQFLSPAFNRRTDPYGGSLDNRARLLLEVVRGVREAVGPDYPLLVKLNSEDFLNSGLTQDEAVQVSVMLAAASVDGIELSGGTVASGDRMPARPGALKTPEDEVFYREAAKLYKDKVAVPLMLVGGIRSYEVAEGLAQGGAADYIALCRPLIWEPGLVKRWHQGDRRRAECISCNACYGPATSGEGLYCVVAAKEQVDAR